MDVSDVLSEKDMMLGIMHYLDRIITQIVKPKVSVFMAIDGVAPRAKLNQQRSRRFRSAKDMAEAADEKRRDKGAASASSSDQLGDKGIFDSNCITPGTEFMEKVSNCIQYFIRKKIKEDPQWRTLNVIYSGHDIPGEGEHKIMQHIRDMKNQPNYQPNTRHCMYGQDADLIMLGLVSHEPHFTLLREIVDFGGGFNRNDNALKAVTKFTKQSDFQLLHLSILREYLAIEFAYGLDPKSYDLERIIDDFTFLTFLVGNDFLPHMPTLDIGDGAFDLLFETYKDQRPSWGEGEYLTYAGDISDPARLENFLKIIGAAETEIFEQREENEAKYLVKKRRWDKRDGKKGGPSDEELAAEEADKQGAYDQMIHEMIAEHGVDAKFVDGWSLPTAGGEESASKDFKGRYYYEKLHFTPIHIDEHLALRKAYIEGLQWCLAYYYRGCISWGWFYPYHYGPLISDLTNLPKVFDEIRFEEGEPLLPFQQLMGCLPPASSTIVPKPYRKLMCEPDSPIIEFYPKEFKVDMNGKKNPWEGVNILPFIDGDLLKKTIAELAPDKFLTPDERRRNSTGKVFIYSYDAAVNDTVPSFNRDIGIMDITKCHSRVQLIEGSHPTNISFKPELLPGTRIPYPGFPSLNVLPMKSAELTPIGLNCFGSSSKYPNTVLSLHTMPDLPGAQELADNILGKHLYINWPMMHEAKVVAISDSRCSVKLDKSKKKKVETFRAAQAQRWEEESDTMKEQYKLGSGMPGSGGLDIGNIQIRLKLLPLQGMKTSPINGSKKKVFGTEEADVPLQMVLWQSPAPDPRFEEHGPLTLKDLFPENSEVVLTKGKYRGCTGKVVGALDDQKVGIKVAVTPPEPPFGLAIAKTVQESYIMSGDASRVLKLHPGIFGKIVGSLYFNPGRYDVGLNLRYKHEFCTLGYTRRQINNNINNSFEKKKAWGTSDTVLVVGNQRSETPDKDGNKTGKVKGAIWEYTPKAIRLVAAFKQEFPKLFAAISKKPNERSYEAKILGPDGDKELKKIREWLDNVETAKMPRTPCSTEAMPVNAVAAIQRAADVRIAAQEEKGDLKEINVKVPSAALYRQGSTAATDVLQLSDGEKPELGDRIVNLCANGLPFGARGTVVGIHEERTGCVEIVMDKEFIGGSTLQGTCANFRGKLCVWNHLLKVSASNSKDIVEQMIPAGSGKALIKNLMKEENQNEQSFLSNASPEKKSTKIESSESDAPKRAKTPNAWGTRPAASRGKPKVKQGTWREAKGPPETGTGFENAGRKEKTGFQKWREMMKGNKPAQNGKKNGNSNNKSSASAGLKAMLGVSTEAPPKQSTDASAGLKNMLGIASSLPVVDQPVPAPAPVQAPSSAPNAAHALLQLMSQGGPPNGAPQMQMPMPVPPHQAGFNFTYVKEGENQQLPPQQHPSPPMYMPGMPMQMPYHPSMGALPPMGMYMQGMAQPSAQIPVNREKKSKDDGASVLVPAALAVKAKK
jgi:5'-3' exoribonuclease 1